MTMPSIVDHLINSISADQTLRLGASSQLLQFEQADFSQFIFLLSQELQKEENSLEIRISAGLLIKNSLTSKGI